MAGVILSCNGRKFNPETENYHSFLAAEIMNGSNESAQQMLDILGGIRVVPESKHLRDNLIGKCSLSDIAKLYNVEWLYLQQLYYRVGISKTLTPKDVDFIPGYCTVLKKRQIGRPGGRYGVSVYSPRVALATAVILDTRYAPYRNGAVIDAYRTIYLSHYGKSANEKWAKFCRASSTMAKRKAPIKTDFSVLEKSDKQVTIDLSVLRAIIDSLANA